MNLFQPVRCKGGGKQVGGWMNCHTPWGLWELHTPVPDIEKSIIIILQGHTLVQKMSIKGKTYTQHKSKSEQPIKWFNRLDKIYSK